MTTTPNPASVLAVRTARLAREAQVRVAYSTRTGDAPGWTRDWPSDEDDARALYEHAHTGCVHSIGYCSYYE